MSADMHEPIEQPAATTTWLDERTGSRGIFEAIFLRKIPKVNWAFTLGSATLFVVVNQFITGILLTIYYVPSVQDAYETVNYIDNTLAMGWLVRGLHHWGATAMVLAELLAVIGSAKHAVAESWAVAHLDRETLSPTRIW